jgi:hypothetical protein
MLPPSFSIMNSTFLQLPRTALGLSALALVAGFAFFFLLFRVLLAAGQQGGATFWANPWLALAILLAGVAGVAGGFAALAAVVRGERSLVLLVPILLGVVVAMFAIGELVGHD